MNNVQMTTSGDKLVIIVDISAAAAQAPKMVFLVRKGTAHRFVVVPQGERARADAAKAAGRGWTVHWCAVATPENLAAIGWVIDTPAEV